MPAMFLTSRLWRNGLLPLLAALLVCGPATCLAQAASAPSGAPADFVAPAEPRPDDTSAQRARSQPGNNAPFWRAVRDSGNQEGTVNLPGVEKGLNSAVQTGVIAGFPMVDLQVQLVDGAYHEVDSSALAFEIASRAAFKEGVAKAGPQLLEPVMRVEVVTPEDYMGDIIGDLNSRRGQITGMEPRGNGQVINAIVPLATMFGYVNTLRSLSQGRAQFTMHFDHYEPVPQMVAEEIRAKYA